MVLLRTASKESLGYVPLKLKRAGKGNELTHPKGRDCAR
jgi:hypothetical protein